MSVVPTPYSRHEKIVSRGGALTQLDKTGFSVENWPAITSAQEFAFGEQLQNKKMLDGVIRWSEPNEARALRQRRCGAKVFVQQNAESGEYRFVANWCEYRTCPKCSGKYRAETATRFEAWVGVVRPKEWRFITLTLQHRDEPLIDQLAFLRASFRRLRQTTLWKETQQHGKAFIEMTYNEHTDRWHPHMHVVSRGSYLSQRELGRVWKRASKGSYIVKVNIMKSSKHVAYYVSKYLGKPPLLPDNASTLSLIEEWYNAMRNKKMIVPYGPKNPLPDIEDVRELADDKSKWATIGSLKNLIDSAARGDAFASMTIEKIQDQMRSATVDHEALPPPI